MSSTQSQYWEIDRAAQARAAPANGTLSDPDSDGFTWQEYLAGTDPQDNQDDLRFDRISFTDNVCELQFNARIGRNYTVQRLDALQATNAWTTLTVLSPAASGPVTVDDPRTARGRFYRLAVTWN